MAVNAAPRDDVVVPGDNLPDVRASGSCLLVVGCVAPGLRSRLASSDGSLGGADGVDGAAAYAQIHWVQPFAQDGHLGLAVTWPLQCSGVAAIGDEFANVDVTGGTTTFDGHVETTGTGDCAASLATSHPGDAVWAACSSYGEVTGVGLGFTKGADNADGDWTAYRTADDPVGSIELGSFTNNLEEYTMEMVTLRPAAL